MSSKLFSKQKLGSHIKLWCLRHSFKAIRYTLGKASLEEYSYCYQIHIIPYSILQLYTVLRQARGWNSFQFADFVLDVLKWRSIVRWATNIPPLPSVPVSCLDERQVYQNLLVPVVTVAWPTETIYRYMYHRNPLEVNSSVWFQGWFSHHLSLSTQALHSLSQAADVEVADHDKEEAEHDEYY